METFCVKCGRRLRPCTYKAFYKCSEGHYYTKLELTSLLNRAVQAESASLDTDSGEESAALD